MIYSYNYQNSSTNKIDLVNINNKYQSSRVITDSMEKKMIHDVLIQILKP